MADTQNQQIQRSHQKQIADPVQHQRDHRGKRDALANDHREQKKDRRNQHQKQNDAEPGNDKFLSIHWQRPTGVRRFSPELPELKQKRNRQRYDGQIGRKIIRIDKTEREQQPKSQNQRKQRQRLFHQIFKILLRHSPHPPSKSNLSSG